VSVTNCYACCASIVGLPRVGWYRFVNEKLTDCLNSAHLRGRRGVRWRPLMELWRLNRLFSVKPSGFASEQPENYDTNPRLPSYPVIPRNTLLCLIY